MCTHLVGILLYKVQDQISPLPGGICCVKNLINETIG